MVPFYIT